MKNLKIVLAATLLLSALWFACRDQDYDEFEKTAKVAFAGRIIDEDGQPVIDAQVRAGNELAVTDANGVFRLAPTRLPAENAKLSVNKIGYFEFSRAYIVQNNALQTVTIQLLRKVLAGTINGNAGGTVQVPGGASLVFPAGAVSHSGAVNVYARYLDPTASDLSLHMPGDLRGINASGEEQSLSTYGMIAVEITDQSGQVLQIDAAGEVELHIPIPQNQAAAVPASVPLWHFDVDKARWIEEGSAQKVGDQYVGKVKHFSYWNCDFNYPTVLLSGKVYIDDDQHPLVNAEVWIGPVGNGVGWGCGHGTTDANGCFSGGVPKDIPLQISIFVYGQCNGMPVYTQTIGPFSQDATLPPIIFSAANDQTVTITGRLLDCAGQPVANGYAKIGMATGGTYTAFTDGDGAFELNTIYCSGVQVTGTLTGFDLTNLLESAPVNFTVSNGTADVGDIQVCNALSEYIQYNLDGQDFLKVYPYGFVNPDSFPGIGSTTELFIVDSMQNGHTRLRFHNNNQTGTFPLTYLTLNNLQADPPGTVSTTVTATGNVGDLIIGTFGGDFQVNGVPHTVSGSYRVIRDQ